MALFEKITDTEQYNDAALPVDMITPVLSAIPTLKAGKAAFGFAKEIKPYLGDIVNGLPLILGRNSTKADIKHYYKKNINKRDVYNEIMGETSFPNSVAGKIRAEYAQQVPFLRYFTAKNKDIIHLNNNKNRIDSDGFYNMKVNWLGKDYDYQYKKNIYTEKPEFHNIKLYELLFKDLNKK
jgi:hypothetical protein